MRQVKKVSVVVQSRSRKGSKTTLRLSNGAELVLRPFVPLGVGDTVVEQGRRVQVSIEDGRKTLTVHPGWRSIRRIKIGDRVLTLVLKEVETEDELEALKKLQAFHYRDSAATGRMVPLIATTNDSQLPPVIGFIEITSALLVNTARKRVLDRAYSDSEASVTWQRWDMATAKKNTRRIARISRCVVYPEIRGLGISKYLTEAAVSYVSTRWHYGGCQPIFVEITADMLRYIPFVKNAGFTFIGQTEGNEQRVLKDMRYLLQRQSKHGANFPKGGGGIMDLQRSYATTLHEVMKTRGIHLETLLNLLRRDPSSLNDDEWIALHRVFRHPKPTYMAGLTTAAKKLLSTAAPAFREKLDEKPKKHKVELHTARQHPLFSIDGLLLSTIASPSKTARARKVAEAFGVVAKDVSTNLVDGLSISISPGEIVLISGPSGSGKSLLLRSIEHMLSNSSQSMPGLPDVRVECSSHSGRPRIAWLETIRSERSAVDLLDHLPIEEALSTLAAAGLGEAPLFVKPTNHFSDGQLYRLGLALALAKKPDLLIADAFCEPLDYFSAATVCKRLQAFCKNRGIAIIAATADPTRLLNVLKPNRVLQLLPGRTHFFGSISNPSKDKK